MAPVHLQGKAIAIAMAGIPVALSLGVPAGAFLGQALDWRVTFLIMTALTIALLPWITTTVPDHPGQRQEAQLDAAELGVRQPVQGILPDDVHGQRTQHRHHGVHLRFGAVVLLATVMGLSWWGDHVLPSAESSGPPLSSPPPASAQVLDGLLTTLQDMEGGCRVRRGE